MNTGRGKGAVALVAGVLFGVGLCLSGMTDPAKVSGFLSFFHGWNPALAFVMGGAIGVHVLVAQWARRREKPLLGRKFHFPAITAIDGRLVLGAALFGVGWGLAGYCPGPAIVSLVTGSTTVAAFVGAMLFGWRLTRALEAVQPDAERPTVAPPSRG